MSSVEDITTQTCCPRVFCPLRAICHAGEVAPSTPKLVPVASCSTCNLACTHLLLNLGGTKNYVNVTYFDGENPPKTPKSGHE